MHATNVSGASGNKYDETDHLFFKLQGATPATIDDVAQIVQKVVKKHGGSKFKRAMTQEEGDLIWQDRKNALFTALAYAGGDAKGWLTDVWYIHIISPRDKRLNWCEQACRSRISHKS
jgi:D-lactate dehydrogenase (cytochrome)